ncbi:MAG: PilZ domain-containing protein [Dehalococcoidia bacterium]
MTTNWSHPYARHAHERHPVWLDAVFRMRPDGRPYPAAITTIWDRGADLQTRFLPDVNATLWLEIYWTGAPIMVTAQVLDSVTNSDSAEMEVAFNGGDVRSRDALQALLTTLAARAAGQHEPRKQAVARGIHTFRV